MAALEFLKLDGVRGDSRDPRHKGEIEVVAWIFDNLRQPSRGDFTVRYDRDLFASLYLQRQGQRIKTGVFTREFYRDGELQSSRTYTFKDIDVESYAVGLDRQVITLILAWREVKLM